jgi:hypothetical protein
MGMGVQGEEGMRGPYVHEGASIGQPSMEIPVGQIHRYTFLSSANQLWFESPGEASLHRRLGARPFSSRSSSLNHGIPLGPAYQFTARMIRRT